MTTVPVGRAAPDPLHDDVRAFYDRYLAAFATRVLADASSYFDVPFCRFVGGRTIIATSPQDVLAWLRSSWARLDDLGCAQVSADIYQLDVIDSQTAILRARGTRSDAHGVPLEGFDVVYTLLRPIPSGQWSIAAVVSTATELFGQRGQSA